MGCPSQIQNQNRLLANSQRTLNLQRLTRHTEKLKFFQQFFRSRADEIHFRLHGKTLYY